MWAFPTRARPARAGPPAGPVFVAGYPRSGTTLAYRILAASGAFAAVEESGDVAHEVALGVYMNPLLDLCGVYAQPWPQWRTVIDDERRFAAFADRACRMGPLRRRFERALTRHVFGDEAFLHSPLDVDSPSVRGRDDPAARAGLRRAAMRVSRRRQVVRSFVALYTAQAGSARMLDKYPFTYDRFPELSAALPRARFLFLVRDPCDVFASMIHRARVELAERIPIGRISWMVVSADTFVRDWVRSVRAARAFADRSPGRIMVVRYEDLTRAPDRVLPGMAAFLGLPEGSLATAQAGSTPGEVPDPTRRFPLRSAAPTANPGRYRDELDESDIATIRRGTAATTAALGYPPG